MKKIIILSLILFAGGAFADDSSKLSAAAETNEIKADPASGDFNLNSAANKKRIGDAAFIGAVIGAATGMLTPVLAGPHTLEAMFTGMGIGAGMGAFGGAAAQTAAIKLLQAKKLNFELSKFQRAIKDIGEQAAIFGAAVGGGGVIYVILNDGASVERVFDIGLEAAGVGAAIGAALEAAGKGFKAGENKCRQLFNKDK